MVCCYRCGKQIKGQATVIVPPRIAVLLYGDFDKAYHPACYRKTEREAEKELTAAK